VARSKRTRPASRSPAMRSRRAGRARRMAETRRGVFRMAFGARGASGSRSPLRTMPQEHCAGARPSPSDPAASGARGRACAGSPIETA
jgi:hypothetical protein